MDNPDRLITNNLALMRILITGGSGFVGHWMTSIPHSPYFRIHVLNREQYEANEDHWQNREWDYIVHLAPTLPDKVIECAKHNNSRVLFSSSGAVYDENPGDYARDKIIAEKMLLDSGCDVVIARMFAFAGAYLKNRYALTNMIHDALGNYDYIRIRSTKTNITRSYLYGADMAIWMWNILLHGQSGHIYEVGSTRAVTMMELAREVQRNITPPKEIMHEPMMTGEPRPYYVPTKANETMAELSVTEYTTFEDAIRKTMDWYRKELGRDQ